MRTVVYLLPMIIFIFYLFPKARGEDTLKAVQVIHRHGDRNPLQPYPTDPYKDLSNWPEGWGALTFKGKEMLYELGRYMKQRYPNIHTKDIIALSSDVRRAVLSGMASLAGFSGLNQSILPNLDHIDPALLGLKVIPSNEDDIISVAQPCAKYDQLWNDFLTRSEVIKQLGEKYKHVFDTINKNTGQNYTPFQSDLIFLIDSVLIEEGRELPMPEWANKLYKSGDLSKIQGIGFALFIYTFEMKRLKTGRIFKKYFDQMDAIIDEDSSLSIKKGLHRPKMTIFSGHDLTIVNWLDPLGLYDDKSPPFGSALFIELHKSDEHKYFVKLYYKNESDLEPHLMTIPKCPNPCNYELLKTVLTPFIVEDRPKECAVRVDDTVLDRVGLTDVHFRNWIANIRRMNRRQLQLLTFKG